MPVLGPFFWSRLARTRLEVQANPRQSSPREHKAQAMWRGRSSGRFLRSLRTYFISPSLIAFRMERRILRAAPILQTRSLFMGETSLG